MEQVIRHNNSSKRNNKQLTSTTHGLLEVLNTLHLRRRPPCSNSSSKYHSSNNSNNNNNTRDLDRLQFQRQQRPTLLKRHKARTIPLLALVRALHTSYFTSLQARANTSTFTNRGSYPTATTT
jgi:hypothetical protein